MISGAGKGYEENNRCNTQSLFEEVVKGTLTGTGGAGLSGLSSTQSREETNHVELGHPGRGDNKCKGPEADQSLVC